MLQKISVRFQEEDCAAKNKIGFFVLRIFADYNKKRHLERLGFDAPKKKQIPVGNTDDELY